MSQLKTLLSALFASAVVIGATSVLGDILLNGEWVRRGGKHDEGTLRILEDSSAGFTFELEALRIVNGKSGAVNTGEIKGTAQKNGNKAVFKNNPGERACELTFTLGPKNIMVRASDGCSDYAGAAVVFDGVYYQ